MNPGRTSRLPCAEAIPRTCYEVVYEHDEHNELRDTHEHQHSLGLYPFHNLRENPMDLEQTKEPQYAHETEGTSRLHVGQWLVCGDSSLADETTNHNQPIQGDDDDVKRKPGLSVMPTYLPKSHLQNTIVVEANKEGAEDVQGPETSCHPQHRLREMVRGRLKDLHWDDNQFVADEGDTKNIPTQAPS